MQIPMPQDEAFKLNRFVESHLTEQESFACVDVIPQEVINELKEFASKFLNIPSKLPKWFWYREGCIHRHQLIQDFSNEYIMPLLGNTEAKLIGDTAFYINFPPHDVHIDSRDFRADEDKANTLGWKSVVVPLDIDTTDYPKLYTSNQYFYGPSTRMRNGCDEIDSKDPEIKRQKSCGVYFSYEYSKDGVKYLDYDSPITQEWYKEHIDQPFFVPYSTLDGITIEKEHIWKPRDVIIFDSARIHFAESLLKRGATFKFGLSLNYGINIQ